MKALIRLILALGLVTAVAGAAYWSLDFQSESRFRTAPIERGDLVIAVSSTGTVEPVETVDVGAQVAGRIERFGFDPHRPGKTIDYGTQVEEGTVLAQIDDALYQVAVEQAQANLKRAEANLARAQAKRRQAERDWRRIEQLGRTISAMDRDAHQATYQVSEAEMRLAEAEVAQAAAALRQAEVNLGYTTIRSPIKGTIIDRRVNVGQTVVASLNAPSLFLLAKDLTRLQVWASVNEADIGQIHPGQKVEFTVDAYPDLTLHGTVAQIRLNATMTHNVVTYTVVVDVDNPDGKLLPYMTANLRFEVARRPDVLLVPNQAFRWHPRPEQIVPEARERLRRSTKRPAHEGAQAPGGEAGADATGTIWVKVDQTRVRPVTARLGLSDGLRTELRDVDLAPGTEVVLGEIRPDDRGRFGPAFVPESENPWNQRKDDP